MPYLTACFCPFLRMLHLFLCGLWSAQRRALYYHPDGDRRRFVARCTPHARTHATLAFPYFASTMPCAHFFLQRAYFDDGFAAHAAPRPTRAPYAAPTRGTDGPYTAGIFFSAAGGTYVFLLLVPRALASRSSLHIPGATCDIAFWLWWWHSDCALCRTDGPGSCSKSIVGG